MPCEEVLTAHGATFHLAVEVSVALAEEALAAAAQVETGNSN